MSHEHDCLRKCVDELLSKPGVFAVGLGEKVSNGQRTGKQAIICSIAKKIPSAQLTKENAIPRDIDGVPTDIIEIGSRPRAFPEYRDKQRPVMPGISTGHYTITAGTIGAFVEVNGETMMLSNNHVFANENDAFIGDPIIQPGKYDGGNLNDKIGNLAWWVPITYTHQSTPTPPPSDDENPNPPSPPPPPAPPAPPRPPREDEDSDCVIAKLLSGILNAVAKALGRSTRLKPVRVQSAPTVEAQAVIRNKVDAAIARVDAGIAIAPNYLSFYSGVKGVNELAGVGAKVHKLGRTTGHTEGIITQTNVTVDVQYDAGVARFENQVVIKSETEGTAFSAGGDSGSLIVDTDDRAVALLFAGNDVLTFANPIGVVMSELNITKFIGPQ